MTTKEQVGSRTELTSGGEYGYQTNLRVKVITHFHDPILGQGMAIIEHERFGQCILVPVTDLYRVPPKAAEDFVSALYVANKKIADPLLHFLSYEGSLTLLMEHFTTAYNLSREDAKHAAKYIRDQLDKLTIELSRRKHNEKY